MCVWQYRRNTTSHSGSETHRSRGNSAGATAVHRAEATLFSSSLSYVASFKAAPSGAASFFPRSVMDAFLVSTVAVAIGELGDKTQLLALVLAARYRRPVDHPRHHRRDDCQPCARGF